MINVFCDGSGKTGKYAYVIEQIGKVRIFQKKGITNNQAEYLAIIAALKDNKFKDICIHSDSQLVVNQLNKKYAIKDDELRKLAQQIWRLCEKRNITFNWVKRQNNLAGKVLG